MIARTTLGLALGAALLTACGSETPAEETTAEADRNAQGEVLGGTISDDMLPLDRLRSQAPSISESPSAPSTAGTDEDVAPDQDEASESAPASEPAPEPEPQPDEG